MLAEPNSNGGHTPKLRTACENCRQSKVKCNLSGKNMCIRCLRHGLQCRYGFANRSGKPKGSKNRATLRKMGQLPEERPGRSSLGDRRQPEFVVDRKCVAEPLRMSYAVDQSMEDVRAPVQSPNASFTDSYRNSSRAKEGYQIAQGASRAQ